MSTLRISHSSASTMSRCGRQWWYRYQARIDTLRRSVALAYGSALHAGAAAIAVARTLGQQVNPEAIFRATFKEEQEGKKIDLPQHWTEDDLIDCGLASLALFEGEWTKRGFTAVIDPSGKPVVERYLEVYWPESDVLYNGVIDILARNGEGKVGLIDWKASGALWSSDDSDSFAARSDQLVGQTLLVEANAAALGIDGLDYIGFGEAIKRKVKGQGPYMHFDLTPPPSDERKADYRREIAFVADDIRRERFTRRSMAAFDSPCAMCDYSAPCVGKADPLLIRKEQRFDPRLGKAA